MGVILRSAGILLILGSLLATVGAYASLRRAQLAAIKEGAAMNPAGLGLASWIGIALMAVGVAAALFALFISLKPRRARALHVGYGQQGKLAFSEVRGGESSEPGVDDVVSILNRVLTVEYSIIVNSPRWLNRIPDQSAAEKVRRVANDSMRHFDATAAMIRRLGGSPVWGFDLNGEETDFVSTLRDQWQRERLAQDLHRRVSELATDENLRQEARAMAVDEEWHAKLIEEVLRTLTTPEVDPPAD